jgi:hypothetical protein
MDLINFRTAFQTTFKPLVWTLLADAGVQGHLWRVIRQLYSDSRSRVAHPKIPPSAFFDIPQGLLEGSKLSPLLFNLAVNDMELQLVGQHPSSGILVKCFGANVSNQTPIQTSIWQYADDVAMITHSEQALKTLLEKMATYCHQRGLTINYDKSHYMEVSLSPYTDGLSLSFKDPVNPLAELSILQVESYKYL